MKKLVSAVLTLALVLSVIVFAPAKEAKAATDYTFTQNTYVLYYPGTANRVLGTVNIYGGYSLKASDLKNIKVSTSAVKIAARDNGRIKFDAPSKNLKFTIACTVSGKTIKCTVDLKFIGNPFKTFNIGTRKLAPKFAKSNYVQTFEPTIKSKGNTTIVASTGWKIKSYYYYNGSVSKSKSSLNVSKLSLGKLAYNGSNCYLRVYVEQVKTGITRTVEFIYIF